MKTIVIECDKCGKDITYGLGYRISLTPERKGDNHPNAATPAVLIHAPIDRTHHFCGLRCLAEWTEQHA